MNSRMQISVISDHAAEHRDLGIGEFRRLGEHLGVVHGAEVHADGGDAEQEAEVADPVDQEGLQVGEDRRLAHRPEADQQVGHQADRLPAEEQLHEVVRHHQHQHREGEQRDVAEEALIAVRRPATPSASCARRRPCSRWCRCAPSATRRSRCHHQRREPIDQEADLEAHAVGDHPGVDAPLKAGSSCQMKRDSTHSDSTAETPTPAMVTRCAPARPICRRRSRR
jgi:hypothetical protein